MASGDSYKGLAVARDTLAPHPRRPRNGVVNHFLYGTLHLNNVAQQWGRMHVGWFDPAGNLLEIHHSPSHKAIDNAHHEWYVDFPAAQDR